jgi:hypothetical protein
LYVFCMCFVCVLYVFCMCFVCVLYVFCMCFVCVLYVFCTCFVCVLYVFCMCFVCVLYVFCMCYTTLSEATRRTIADCVPSAELKPVVIKSWNTTRYELQWFQLTGRWWNPRYRKQEALDRSAVLDVIISKFYEANKAGLQKVFESAPFPYAGIYQERRLLGHIAAQYYSNDALLRDSTFHYDGEEFFLVCVRRSGSCQGTFT